MSSANGTEKGLPLEIGYPVIAVTFCSVVMCITVISILIKSRPGNFFKWKIIDRFTMYTIVCDLLFFTAQVGFGVHTSIIKENPKNIACQIHAITILEFGFAQIIMSVIMAVFIFVLVIKNRKLKFGAYDYKFLMPTFVIPLLFLIPAAVVNQLAPNISYCSFKEERGFFTWNFLTFVLGFISLFLAIIVLYTIMWSYVYRTSREISATLQQQSAVNSRRLGYKLSLYVLVYLVQFGGNAVEGFWISIEAPPMSVRAVAIILSVTGGILNGLVYLKIRKSQ